MRPMQLERNKIRRRAEEAVRVTRVKIEENEGHGSGFGFCSQGTVELPRAAGVPATVSPMEEALTGQEKNALFLCVHFPLAV